MNEQQHALAEAALAESVARYPHESGAPSTHIPRTLPLVLQDRYEQLMAFAKNPNWKLTAQENLASARELVDTAYHLGSIDEGPWQAYVIETNIAKLECLDGIMGRAIDARSRS